MNASDYSFFDIEIRDGIVFAEMTHPDYSPKERPEWPRLIDDVAEDDDVHVLVITGWGNPRTGTHDGSGGGLDPYHRYARAAVEPIKAFLDLNKPVVMAVDGNPGILTIPLCGDFLIVERHCTFADSHVLGGTASATQPFQWPLNTGLMKAKRYILTGDSFSAEEGLEMGLFTEVVDTGKSRERAAEYASKLTKLRPESLHATKSTLNAWLQAALVPVLDRGLALEFLTFPEGHP